MERIEKILDVEIDGITVARTISADEDAPYEFMIDWYEPTRCHAFQVDDIHDTEAVDAVIDERDPNTGIIITEDKETGTVYACGVGDYNRTGSSIALIPIGTYFEQ